MRHFQNWAFVQKFMKASCPKRKFIFQPPICRGKLVSGRFVLRCIEDNTGSWPQHVAAAGGFARFLGVLVTWLPAFLCGEFLRSDPSNSKDYSFDCWSCKDHCATKHFQLTNPLDSYFYSLGLPGWFVTLYNLFSGLWPKNPASTTWRQEIADRFVHSESIFGKEIYVKNRQNFPCAHTMLGMLIPAFMFFFLMLPLQWRNY